MLSLAVFYFVFLGTEYLFDNRVALYTDPTGVVLAQSYILGVSALGFLAYSLIEVNPGIPLHSRQRDSSCRCR